MQRRPQHLSKKRAQANDPIVLDEWFEWVRKLFASSKLDKFESETIAERLWNCDKTGFCTAVASKQVLAKKGSKAVYEVGGGSVREYITVLGKRNLYTKPIYSLHNFQVVDQHLAEGCHHSLCIKQNTCMIHGSKEVLLVQHTVYLGVNFLSCFTKIFLKEVELLLRNGPVILFVDGHHSHINLELINVAREYKVHIMCLPTKLDAHFATDGCWGILSTEAVLLQHFEGVQNADYG